MEPTERGATPRETPVETALQRKCDDADSASYSRTVRTVVTDFLDRSGVTTVEEIDVRTMREYARSLRKDAEKEDEEDGSIAKSTAQKYFATTRAFLGWCVRERIIETNPAHTSEAEEPLPETDGQSDPQFWDPDDRDRLLHELDANLGRALDGEADVDWRIAQRDQVLCWLLGYSGVRGAEILNDRDETHPLRQGLRWENVRLEEGTLVVLGKTRDTEYPTLPTPVVDRLRRWKTRLKPASEEWPVFPTLAIGPLHRPRSGAIGDLEPHGYETDSDVHPIDACREHGVTPPAMTVEAGRNRLRNYSGLWDLPTDAEDDDAYMEPHGGRRSLGGELYETKPTLAQDQLRHNSIETTNLAYRDKDASKRQQDVDEALGFDDS